MEAKMFHVEHIWLENGQGTMFHVEHCKETQSKGLTTTNQ